MKFITTLALGLFCIALGSPASFAQGAATIDGKWHFVLDTPGGDREVDSEFAVDKDGKVTGTWGTAAVAGTFADGKLNMSFTITSDEAGETAPIKITGKLDQGDLTGDWEFTSYSGTFKASRPKSAAAPAAQDIAAMTIAGKWHFVLDTPGGDREIESELAVDKDGNVTGKWGNSAVAGTFLDGKLNLSFSMTADETGETGLLKIAGKLEQGGLTGNWEFSSYSGTFKASRSKTA
jgi:hypothetical protein